MGGGFFICGKRNKPFYCEAAYGGPIRIKDNYARPDASEIYERRGVILFGPKETGKP
jgi:hypothetical protein